MTAHELAAKLLALPDHEVHIYDDEMQRIDPIYSVHVEWSDGDGGLPNPNWRWDGLPPPDEARGKFNVPSVVIRMGS